MKLCDHVVLAYQEEIKAGNEPVFIVAPSPEDKYAHIKLCVIFKKPLQMHKLPNIEEVIWRDTWSPCTRGYMCRNCECMVDAPIDPPRLGLYERDPHAIPNKEIVAAKDNVYVEDGFYGKFLVPIDKWKEE
ncbi:MAG: hypothetical protein E7666_01150 [Ruminococcaceae bacterium]|nr:hypothetical protein [Oscillospiraceae bacterium]